MSTQEGTPTAVGDWEREEVDAANGSGKPPVVFVHGLWLLASSWDRWAELFREAGYSTLQPGWPGDCCRPGRSATPCQDHWLRNQSVGSTCSAAASGPRL